MRFAFEGFPSKSSLGAVLRSRKLISSWLDDPGVAFLMLWARKPIDFHLLCLLCLPLKVILEVVGLSLLALSSSFVGHEGGFSCCMGGRFRLKLKAISWLTKSHPSRGKSDGAEVKEFLYWGEFGGE